VSSPRRRSPHSSRSWRPVTAEARRIASTLDSACRACASMPAGISLRPPNFILYRQLAGDKDESISNYCLAVVSAWRRRFSSFNRLIVCAEAIEAHRTIIAISSTKLAVATVIGRFMVFLPEGKTRTILAATLGRDYRAQSAHV
jgi:hypothetical protein